MKGNHTLLSQGANIVRSTIITRASHGSDGPPEKKTNSNEAKPHTNDKWAPRAAQGTKEKVGGPTGRPADPPVGQPAHGPHRLQSSMCHSLIGSLSRFRGFPAEFLAEERVAPLYIYEGKGSISSIQQPIIQEIKLLSQDVVIFSCRGLRTRGVWV